MDQSTASSSTTANAASIDIQETTSLTFPDGHGDITLITIDNVIFHVHRAILHHSSHVFETIFEKEEGDQDTSHQPRLKMEAEASTLDHLLMFAYPNKLSPSIEDMNVLAAVFRAAKRYEMDGVLQQLSRSLMEMRIVDEGIEAPLYTKAPLAVLAISYAFDCSVLGRFALRECVKGSLKEHLAGATGFDVPIELLSEILRLRQERIDSFVGSLNGLPWSYNGNCLHCVRKQGEWRAQTIRGLHDHLLFESFRKALTTPIGSCVAGHATPPGFTLANVDGWSATAIGLEQTLPALPQLSP